MQKEPILVLLAAGMGSRYGGLKQIDALGPGGEVLMDYSLYDARRAGFKRILFILKKQDEEAFRGAIGRRIEKEFPEVRFSFQEISDLPEGFDLPEDRVKPWGTGHAVLAARREIDAAFAVINADDYYGPEAFATAYQQLSEGLSENEALLITYILGRTLSEYGTVSRGVCQVKDDFLSQIVERKTIKDLGDAAAFTEDGGNIWTKLSKDLPVSMNFWGFHPQILKEFEADFIRFMKEDFPLNPLKSELVIPGTVDRLIRSEKLHVRCMLSPDRWFGVTYREDRPRVMEELRKKTEEGLYPSPIWRS